MGCLARLGCLILLVLLCLVGWLTRDRWLPLLRGRASTPAASTTADVWQPLTPAGAQRTRDALMRLSRPSGPVFANVGGADAASYIYQALQRKMPPSTDSVEAAVLNDRLCLRASVKLSELGGPAVIGPVAEFLGDRNRMQFCGDFHVVHPGLAEYQVKEIRLRDIAVPQGAIPKLLEHIERGARPVGTSPDGLPLLVPDFIGDIRVANGKVTVYKTT